MKDKFYTLKQVSEIIDEKPKRIQYWILQRLFEPFDPSTGTGTTRKFSFQNLLEISIASALSDATLNIKIVRYIINQIHRDAPDFFSEGTDENHEVLAIQLIGESKVTRVFDLNTETELIPEFLSEGLPVLVFDLCALKVNLLKRL